MTRALPSEHLAYGHACLVNQMAVLLRESGADLGDEPTCIQVLMNARFRWAEIKPCLDEAMAKAAPRIVQVGDHSPEIFNRSAA